VADEEPVVTELDGPWKEALDLAPRLVLSKLWPELVGGINWTVDYQSLDNELQRLTPEDRDNVRRVDRLLLFEKLDGDPLYLHIEVHCYHDRDLGHRVMTYRHRLRGRFGKAPVTLIVFGDGSRRWRPRGHREGEMGSDDTCRWLPVKLRDFEGDIAGLEADENVFNLFLAAHLLTRRTSKDFETRAEHKLRLLSNVVSRTVEDGANWFRVIDWIMALPTDLNDRVHLAARRKEDAMAFVSYWEQKGIEQGMKKGLEQGIQQGIQQGTQQGIEKGEVIGQIRHCQKILKITQTPPSELAARPLEELSSLLTELEARLLPGPNGSHPSP
jgi:hypothetical protein